MKTRLAGGEIAWDERGRGDAILLLHAFPLGRVMWDAQMEAFSPSWRVIRFDARGFGGSPPGDALLTMERIADDAVALLDHLDVSRAVVCGLSMGGYAAFALVRRHPGRVRALVLADTRAEPDTDGARATRAQQAEQVRKDGSAAIADTFLARLVGPTAHATRPQVVERLRGIISSTAPRGIADALAGLAARADSRPTLREIRVPTLVVCGEEDEISPLAEMEGMQKAIAGSRLAVIPRAGHLSAVEDPAAFDAAVTAFLRALP